MFRTQSTPILGLDRCGLKRQRRGEPVGGTRVVMEKLTLQGINLSHLGKRKIIFKMPFLGGYVSSLEGTLFPTILVQFWKWPRRQATCLGRAIFQSSQTTKTPVGHPRWWKVMMFFLTKMPETIQVWELFRKICPVLSRSFNFESSPKHTKKV